MKKLLVLFSIALITVASFAQTESQHLTFKGVPIDGTLSEFVQKMEQKGFEYVATKDGISMLTGDFAAFKGCIIGVSTLKQKDLVSSIVVLFPNSDKWADLSNNYYTLKEMLSQKYGKPDQVEENFQNREPIDDNDKMYELRMDRCNYVTTFKTPNGSIQLTIANMNYRYSVVLSYTDKINSEIIIAHAIDDL